MTNPITPPLELLRELSSQFHNGETLEATWAIAFQAGADQELAACCLLLDNGEYAASYGCHDGTSLRAARRPKPQTLNSIALEMLGTIEKMDVVTPEITDTIRLALKELTK
jgi:hypothetical protein